MKHKVKLMLILTLTISTASIAGFNGLTHHSRANCANNETISWDWTTNHLLKTVSLHEYNRTSNYHSVVVDWNTTWRSAAVHWGEGRGKWSVLGQHLMKDRKGKEYIALQQIVYDCSVYDGWWEYNK